MFSQKSRVELGLQMLCFTAFYLVCFSALEAGAHSHYHTIGLWLDTQLPFLPFFIIPYFAWFGYIFVAVFWLLFYTKSYDECCVCISSLMTGMTIFLLISAVYPNSLDIRPEITGTDIFSRLVAFLYRTDTPTNVFPSIHVFNTTVVCQSVIKNTQKRSVKIMNITLSVLIILSTVFLKQHSVLDVIAGLIMAAGLRKAAEKIFEKEGEKEEGGVFSCAGSFGMLDTRQK